MNILFIYPNINGFHQDTYSFGLASIVAVAKKYGYAPKVIIVRARCEYRSILDEIAVFKPQLVGFSAVSSQFSFVKEMCEEIKKEFPDAITVCGGVHPTINPRCIQEAKALDAAFVGESENSFIDFLKKLEKKEPYKDVDNLAYVEGDNIIVNKLKPLIQNLDDLPSPDREIYPFKGVLKTMGYAPFLFSRGCPYMCSYCSNHAIAKAYNSASNHTRHRSAESSIQEIESAVDRFSIGKILIADEIFGIDKAWREEFCGKYRKRIRRKFQCLLRVNLINEEFIKLLKWSGCYRVAIGVESGNEFVRNRIMNRQMTNEQIIKAFSLARKYGLQTNAINIIGMPGETEEMIWDTINLNRKIKPTSSGCNIFYPYKGTKLGDECFKNGLVDEKLYADFSNERRSSVLNYPEEYKKKLAYYRQNWEKLINRFNLMWKSEQSLRFILMKMGLLNFLINTKRNALAYIYSKQNALKSSGK